MPNTEDITTTNTTHCIDDEPLNQQSHARTPEVDTFDGNDLKAFLSFKLNLDMKFLIDGACFHTDQKKIIYAYRQLRDRASQRMLPWIQAKIQNNGGMQWDEFKNALDQAFGDKDLKEKALVRVNTMKQGGKDMDEFLAEFDEALVMAEGLT